MPELEEFVELKERFIQPGNSECSDYFSLLSRCVALRAEQGDMWQAAIDEVYDLVDQEIRCSRQTPIHPIRFGTSGWRGVLGKDFTCRSVALVTTAIVDMYKSVAKDPILARGLGIQSYEEALKKGCVIGHDNRFGGSLLSSVAAGVLLENGFSVHFAGEATTGSLSAAVLKLSAAFSINLTPSHNPFEYGGYKFNGVDGGPASPEVTDYITAHSNKLVREGMLQKIKLPNPTEVMMNSRLCTIDALSIWKELVQSGQHLHGLCLEESLQKFKNRDDIILAVDSVHGASRLDIGRIFDGVPRDRVFFLRSESDVTFGGVSPEPSRENLQGVIKVLNEAKLPLKIGAIIDPDGDRIRLTDGKREIGMNQFGAMAYHFIHTYKNKKGMVAKTVATSNLVSNIASRLGEEVFESAVGFKNFKPVIGKALVCFEESDGITVIGHTPEKDAYIGLLLALEIVLVTGMGLGDYLKSIEAEFGTCHAARDGLVVEMDPEEMKERLQSLKEYVPGKVLRVGKGEKQIAEVVDIDGRKMILENGAWVMIRPSGTEPKIRLYSEASTETEAVNLLETARNLLNDCQII